jgi:hypothetical protein
MEINVFFNLMYNNVKNVDDYVIYISRNAQYLFDSKNNKEY